MLNKIDNFLNNITMYKVVLYGLLLIAFCAAIFSFFGLLPFSSLNLVISLVVLTFFGFFSNILFSKIFKAPINHESSTITALILFLILQPARNWQDLIILSAVAVLANLSKFFFAYRKKHLFNPAAITALISAYIFQYPATWWVGSLVLLPSTLVAGLLIIRKIRRVELFTSFFISGMITILFFGFVGGSDLTKLLLEALTSWPIIFFGTVMLTEPLTTPATKSLQIQYGILVGFLFGLPFRWGSLLMTPELALVVGNLFSYLLGTKQKFLLKFESYEKIASELFEFNFSCRNKLIFFPGQYLEWTLPHSKTDSRGNRRYFTIASSPTEPEIKLGVKIPEDSSSFKKMLKSLKKGAVISADHLAGEFILPEDEKQKLIFIAGGIGITPFRSMIKYLLDTNQKRDIKLLYVASSQDEFAYESIFAQAEKELGIKTTYVITKKENAPKNWRGPIGYLSQEMIKEIAPDFQKRYFYVSGPHSMVEASQKVLTDLKISKNKVITDYFPGF